MVRADTILTGFEVAATLAEGSLPRRGAELGNLSLLERPTIALSEGRIAWIGRSSGLRRQVILRKGGTRREFSGGTLLPGLVDAHTHLVFAGDRSGEVRRKILGESYLDIAGSGGGLFRTVRETRKASEKALVEEARGRLHRLLRWGTTSLEAKSGYGLSLSSELKLLRVVRELQRSTPAQIVPTFLGAHAVPPEYEGRREVYVNDLVRRQIPAVAKQGIARFCDVFCEEGFFTAEESRWILTAGKASGLAPKIHADEFTSCGGSAVAAEVRAVSADHLLAVSPDDVGRLARTGVVAVLLPLTPFASMSNGRSKGRELVDGGVPIALGSDLCPNSWVEGMPLVISHAVYSAHLTPAEALSAATVNAAFAIGLPEAGRLVPGARGDLAIFDIPGPEHLGYRLTAPTPTEVFLAGKSLSAPGGAPSR
ncbi:MAG: imidazolonepropionase [Candidatus Thermoplasmatota archaeon]|nr:imidazolonepropionase [Candidatus Thermoplasmatota archaeon]